MSSPFKGEEEKSVGEVAAKVHPQRDGEVGEDAGDGVLDALPFVRAEVVAGSDLDARECWWPP